ncbi:DUF2789 domain-containing protein [Biformimicrobium ophioploci]|uniref:DUF2789 domain-containing protein n=1 Tax=Biformimicrobium ophioploci TaxID=3036711 RepID=A0ABQ6LYQ0_9GAMM|nr:DUF2789 domain-containing protein [Microbulbifer sp. NKW57]GMG87212.1 DUF2789 domain-containing protein [Microbulbifer sp. NKW57]
MEPSQHTINELFSQLGLGSEDGDIDAFIDAHQLKSSDSLLRAEFWSDSQRSFLQEALESDSDWCEVVDQLDARLRQ